MQKTTAKMTIKSIHIVIQKTAAYASVLQSTPLHCWRNVKVFYWKI